MKKSVVIKLYRIEHWFWKHRCRIISKIIYHIIQILFGCSIPPSVVLEKNVDIPHFHGIVIHQDTIVKEGTLIYQNVTIGGRNGEAGAVIGKNCVISAGACILGKINIGDNAKVGANAVVLTDVPSGATAVGVPAVMKVAKTECEVNR